MRFRVFINYIGFLITEDGVRIIKFVDIEKEIVGFYKGVMGLIVCFLFVIDL